MELKKKLTILSNAHGMAKNLHPGLANAISEYTVNRSVSAAHKVKLIMGVAHQKAISVAIPSRGGYFVLANLDEQPTEYLRLMAAYYIGLTVIDLQFGATGHEERLANFDLHWAAYHISLTNTIK